MDLIRNYLKQNYHLSSYQIAQIIFLFTTHKKITANNIYLKLIFFFIIFFSFVQLLYYVNNWILKNVKKSLIISLQNIFYHNTYKITNIYFL